MTDLDDGPAHDAGDALSLDERTTVYQDPRLWLKAREGKITGSRVPIILGLNRHTSPLELWMELVGLAPPPETNYSMERGSHMEAFVLRKLNDELPDDLFLDGANSLSIVSHPTIAEYQYSPDDLVRCYGQDKVHGVAEAKSFHPRGAKDWDQEIPHVVAAQVRFGMECLDVEHAYVCVDLHTESRWGHLERDPAWWDEHSDTVMAFLECVQTETPPEPAGHARDNEALGALYSADKVIEGLHELHPDFVDEVSEVQWQREQLGRVISDATKKKKKLDARVKAYVKEHEAVHVHGLGVFKWSVVPESTSTRREHRRLSFSKEKTRG